LIHLEAQNFDLADPVRGNFSLIHAIFNEHLDIANFLLQKGVDINPVDSDYKSAMSLA